MKTLFYIRITFQLIVIGIGCVWMNKGGCDGIKEVSDGSYLMGIVFPLVYFMPIEYQTCISYNNYIKK